MFKIRNILFTIVLLLFCSCEAVQDSAGKAFDNAGSVIRTGEEKAYIKSDKKQQKSNVDEAEYQRY